MTTEEANPPRMSSATVRGIALLIVGASALIRLAMNLQGFFAIDDYVFIGRATAPDALSWQALLEPHQGHVSPGGQLLTWVMTRVTPLEFTSAAVLMSLGWLACLLLMYRILTMLWAPVPGMLIPLLAYAVSPLMVQVTTWWSAAINAVPLQLCSLLVVYSLIPFARGGGSLSWRRQLALVASCAVAAAFFEKAALLGPLAFGLALVWSSGTGWSAVARAWQAARGAWVALLALTVGYAITYAALLAGGPSDLPRLTLADSSQRAGISVIRGLVPGLVGGPIDVSPGLDPWAIPPLWVVGLSVGVLVLAAVVVVEGSTPTRRLGLLCVAYAVACLAAPAIGRAGYVPISAAALRYFADLAVPLTLLLASIVRDRLGERPTRSTWQPWTVAFAILAAYVTLSLVTFERMWERWSDNPSRDIAMRALDSLAQRDPQVPLLDVTVPADLISALYGKYTASSLVLGSAPRSPGFAEQSQALAVWAPDGRLLPARVEGPGAVGSGACPWPVSPTATITVTAPLVNYRHVVALTTTSTAATRLQVTVGEGAPVVWDIPAGRATSYRWQAGGGSNLVTVTALESSPPAACVLAVQVGAPVPIDESG